MQMLMLHLNKFEAAVHQLIPSWFYKLIFVCNRILLLSIYMLFAVHRKIIYMHILSFQMHSRYPKSIQSVS